MMNLSVNFNALSSMTQFGTNALITCMHPNGGISPMSATIYAGANVVTYELVRDAVTAVSSTVSVLSSLASPIPSAEGTLSILSTVGEGFHRVFGEVAGKVSGVVVGKLASHVVNHPLSMRQMGQLYAIQHLEELVVEKLKNWMPKT